VLSGYGGRAGEGKNWFTGLRGYQSVHNCQTRRKPCTVTAVGCSLRLALGVSYMQKNYGFIALGIALIAFVLSIHFLSDFGYRWIATGIGALFSGIAGFEYHRHWRKVSHPSKID